MKEKMYLHNETSTHFKKSHVSKYVFQKKSIPEVMFLIFSTCKSGVTEATNASFFKWQIYRQTKMTPDKDHNKWDVPKLNIICF